MRRMSLQDRQRQFDREMQPFIFELSGIGICDP